MALTIEYHDPCEGSRPLRAGDRVRIREGYYHPGTWGFYDSKHHLEADKVHVTWGKSGARDVILAAAIEPYPYTREERIERAIEDLDEAQLNAGDWYDQRAALFAILEAGV